MRKISRHSQPLAGSIAADQSTLKLNNAWWLGGKPEPFPGTIVAGVA